MKNLLIETIENLGYPVFQQGALGENEEYPDTFFTFWNNSSNDRSHYDNEAVNYVWDFDLNIYSIDPSLVNSLLLEAKEKLIKEGFIVNGKGYDVASDESTHTGRGINIKIIDN